MYKKSVVIIAPALFAAALVVSTSATARQIVTLSGTYSRGQVKKDCDASGGAYISLHDGSYSCYSQSGNGNVVDCNKRGKCTGSIPRQSKPSHTIGGILHPPSGVKTTGGSTSPKRGRHLTHLGGLKKKAAFHRSTGPTNPNGPGGGTGPFAPPNHRHSDNGGLDSIPMQHASDHHSDFRSSGSGKH